MSGLFGQSEKVNNVLFVGILILLVGSLFLLSGMFKLGELLNVRFETDVILLVSSISLYCSLFLPLFSSIIFGYVSKSPKKSFLLGFLVWASLPLFSIISIIISFIIKGTISEQISILYACLFLLYFMNGIISGGAGYFVAANHPDKKRRIIYPLVLFLITISLYLVTLLIGFAIAMN